MAEGTHEGEGAVRSGLGPESDLETLAPIPKDAWVRIHLAHPVHGDAHIDIVGELMDLAEDGHHEAGHGNRVALLAERLAQGLDDSLAKAAFRAGLLHDVGKALLPFHPATLPRRLSRTERRVVDRHPLLGAQFASWAGEPNQVIAGILGHHERIDGTGYPNGLRGDEVPLLAQIVAAADVMEALRARRSYKPSWSLAAIRAYFRAHRRGWLAQSVWAAAMDQISLPDALAESPVDFEANLLEQP